MRKLTDSQVAEIRVQGHEGRSASEIAADFGVSDRHVGRIVSGKARPAASGLSPDVAREVGVAAALENLLAGRPLSAAQIVTAETCRALARQLDAASPTAASAAAAPALARQLVDLVGQLAGDERPPDRIDEINARRDARRLAAAAAPMRVTAANAARRVAK
jgi:hypothetical protein